MKILLSLINTSLSQHEMFSLSLLPVVQNTARKKNSKGPQRIAAREPQLDCKEAVTVRDSKRKVHAVSCSLADQLLSQLAVHCCPSQSLAMFSP